MKLVRLYGFLGEQFGTHHYLEVESSAEAVRALCCTIPEFEKVLNEEKELGFCVFVDDRNIGEDKLNELVSDSEVIKIVPELLAAKSDGMQILIGAALIFTAIYLGPSLMLTETTFMGYEMSAELASTLIYMGTAQVLGGVSQMLASTPHSGDGSIGNKSDSATYAFSGPVNTAAQGAAIPILYGRLRVGSIVGSAGIDTNVFYKGHGNPSEAGVIYGNGDSTPWSWVLAPSVN